MAKTKNKYAYPIELNEEIRMTYDESPAHVDELKYSVDFVCREGLPVLAAQDGIVIALKSDSNLGGEGKEWEEYGNYIEIKHDNDEVSEYEHLKQDGVVVKIGDQVKKGQVIGYTGATGWIAHLGPHLHFMIGKYDDNNIYRTLEIVWEE